MSSPEAVEPTPQPKLVSAHVSDPTPSEKPAPELSSTSSPKTTTPSVHSVHDTIAAAAATTSDEKPFHGPQDSGSITTASGTDLPPPNTASPRRLQRWNEPRTNVPRVMACFWAMFVMGANDAAYGALIPYLERYYSLSYTVVSLIFLSPFVGYISSAILNNHIHMTLGQRGVAALCSSCHIIAYVVIAVHPPYPVLVVVYMLAGFGNGLADGAWNAFMGSLENANQMLGFLHGIYGAGAVVSPLVATTMITKAGTQWFEFYYLMIGMAVVEVILTVGGFWTATGAEYRKAVATDAGDHPTGTLREALTTLPSARVTWLSALFLLGYVGIEVSLGGWIVVFMINERGGGEFDSGMVATGFWLGLTIGRVVLGFVTPKIGEWRAMVIYLPIAVALELIFWLVPQFYVSAVAIGLQGFFLGPLFPAAVVAMSKLLPRHLHVGAIGFAAAFGGSGAAILPFAVGAIAQAKGVQVLQPIILALMVAIFALWLGVPKFGARTKK